MVQDSVGNTILVRDTLQGFPLRIVFTPPSTSATAQTRLGQVNFLTTDAGTTTCQTVQAWNDGLLPLILNAPFLQSNVIFSSPLSQFPLRIPPGEFRKLTVCFSPELIRQYRDTLTLTRFCDNEVLSLQGDGGVRILESNSRCSVDVRLIPRIGLVGNTLTGNSFGTIGGLSNNTLIPNNNGEKFGVLHSMIYPNPANEYVILNIDNLHAGDYVLGIYSVVGSEITSVRLSTESISQAELIIYTNNLESGTYFYRLIGKSHIATGSLKILR